MKIRILALAAILAVCPRSDAQTTLTAGEVELAINFVPAYVGSAINPWLLAIRNPDALVEYAGVREGSADPERVRLVANEQTRIVVPNDTRFSALGTPGGSAWLLPDAPDESVLTPGISLESRATQAGWQGVGVAPEFLAQGVPGANTFIANRITLTLMSFTGPGHFSLYRLNGFGDPIWYFRTDDGLTTGDARTFNSASHSDLNWAFTAPGNYTLGFRAAGLLTSGQSTASDVTLFHFQVVPEPRVGTLLAAAIIVAWSRRPSHRFAP